MLDKILIANRGDDERGAPGAAQPNCLARAGDFTAEAQHV
jgi:hypothetical protein